MHILVAASSCVCRQGGVPGRAVQHPALGVWATRYLCSVANAWRGRAQVHAGVRRGAHFPGSGCHCREGQRGLAPARRCLGIGRAAGLLQPLSARGPLPSRTGWGMPRIKSGVGAGFCGRVLWPCCRGKGSWEEKCLPGVPVSVPSAHCCLLPAGWGRQRCSDLRHHPSGRDVLKDWQLCLKMQKLRLFRSRNPGACARETFALAAGEWADGFLLAAARSWLRRADLHLYAGPASLGCRLRRIDEHKERDCLLAVAAWDE